MKGKVLVIIFVLFAVFFGGKVISVKRKVLTPVLAQTCNQDLLMKGDLNCDGKITILDFAIWKTNYLLFKKGEIPTPTRALLGCSETCTNDAQCAAGYCYFAGQTVLGARTDLLASIPGPSVAVPEHGVCRNRNCPETGDCNCVVSRPTNTPVPTSTPVGDQCGAGVSGYGCFTSCVGRIRVDVTDQYHGWCPTGKICCKLLVVETPSVD